MSDNLDGEIDRDYGAAYTSPNDVHESIVGESERFVPNHRNWPAGWFPAKVEPGALGQRATAPPFYHRGKRYESDYAEHHADDVSKGESIL